jgi:hypothetical protein
MGIGLVATPVVNSEAGQNATVQFWQTTPNSTTGGALSELTNGSTLINGAKVRLWYYCGS